MSGAQLLVLELLRSNEPQSISDLASHSFTHQSSVSVVVKRLTEKGLAKRISSEQDARQTQVSITSKGVKTLERAPSLAQHRLIEGLQQLSTKEQELLANLLRKWIFGSTLNDEPESMFFEDDDRKP